MLYELAQMLYGAATWVPGLGRLLQRGTGGTDSAAYCYSVWLRHLLLAYENSLLEEPPETLAELGPGDSLGIGLAALLSGTRRYIALDAVEHADPRRNLAVLDELLSLFRRRAEIPGEDLLPEVKPRLASYGFPHRLLGASRLRDALAPERVEAIRQALRTGGGDGPRIRYIAPWDDPSAVEGGSVDMLLSQAVLEHVRDPRAAYEAMARWLRPRGFLSHQVDFRCHGTSRAWNGHWTYSPLAWRLVRGSRPYLLNRLPASAHLALLEDSAFELVQISRVRTPSELDRRALAPPFEDLSEDDLTTSGAFFQAVRR